MRIILALLLCLMLSAYAYAAVVDASTAEAAFLGGDFPAAREAFAALVEQFRTASKDSNDFRVYREAAYLYDRLADCCFTQRDWEALKLYADGLVVVSVSERNLADEQLSGALMSGIAYATASYLSERLDESVRFSSLMQLKRSICLVLVDSHGEGEQGQGAITLYQRLAAAMRGILAVEDGAYELDINALDANLDEMESILTALEELSNIDVLWEKYPPQGRTTDETPGDSPAT